MEKNFNKCFSNKKINHNFKRISPINRNRYFIKIDNNWLNLNDIYKNINNGNNINPITNKILTNNDITKIQKLYKNTLEINDDKSNDNLLNDYIDLFESQIEDLYNRNEELYSLLQTQQHLIDKLHSRTPTNTFTYTSESATNTISSMNPL